MGKDGLGNSAPLALREEEEEQEEEGGERRGVGGEKGGGSGHLLDGDEIKAPDSGLDMQIKSGVQP